MRSNVGVFIEPAHPCTMKVSYSTKAKARNASGNINARFGGKQRPYKCPRCDSYHLTSLGK